MKITMVSNNERRIFEYNSWCEFLIEFCCLVQTSEDNITVREYGNLRDEVMIPRNFWKYMVKKYLDFLTEVGYNVCIPIKRLQENKYEGIQEYKLDIVSMFDESVQIAVKRISCEEMEQ